MVKAIWHMDEMHQARIRHPVEGDELGVVALLAEIKGTMDGESRDIYAAWLMGQQEAIFDERNAGPSKALLAIKDDRIVGLTRFPSYRDRGWIRLVYVLSEFRGQGIEELLFKGAMQRLKDGQISLIGYDSPPPVPSYVALPAAILLSEGFSTLTRVLLEKRIEMHIEPVILPYGYSVKKWDMDLIDDFAKTIHEIWGPDHIEAIFIPEYSTLEDIRESLRQSAEGKWAKKLGLLDHEATLLLYHGDTICGVSECYRWEEEKDARSITIGFVGMLGLIHGYRGKGLGELLMRIILKRFADGGMKYARVNPTVENVPAFNLYKKLGFTEIEERSTVYYWRR